MRLDRLELKGFTRFTDPAVLDLTAIPEGSLVAIVGANGEGKTTILDAGVAPLYLGMPSRGGRLATYATDRGSYFDNLYTLPGVGQVRARVNVDAAGKRDSDAVLAVTSERHGGERLLNDGKVRTFQAAVAKLFPPRELFLASAFAAQTRTGSFITASPAARKDLFSICLGMQQFEAWAETAKAAAAVIDSTLARLDGRRQVLEGLTGPAALEELRQRAAAVDEEFRTAAHNKAGCVDALELGAERRPTLEADVAAHGAAVASLTHRRELAARDASAALERQRARDARVRDWTARRASLVQAFVAELERLAVKAQQQQAAHDEAIRALEERIAGNRTLEQKADDIRAAAAQKRASEAELARWRTEEVALRAAITTAHEALETARANDRAAERDVTALETARRQAELLERVPCGGADQYVGCQFLTDARHARGQLATLESAVAAAAGTRQAVRAATDQLRLQEHALSQILGAIHTHAAAVERVSKLAAYEPELAATEARITGYRREIAREEAAKVQVRTTYADECARAQAAQADTLDEGERAHELALAADDAELDALEDRAQEHAPAIRAAQSEVDRTGAAFEALRTHDAGAELLRKTLRELEHRIGALQADQRALNAELADRGRHQAELARVVERLADASAQLLTWQTLHRCFARDGLPTLEIGNAGPTVSALTNDLLNVGFGPRFTVDVVTQTARADGKGLKEEFTIRVFDNAHGGERDIADLSGGERVLVEEALRAAISLFVNQRNVSPIRTIFRDETTGALDPENAVRYVAMLRRLVQLGGIAHCLFITHNAECADLADVQVHVADGRLEVQRPPFRRAS